MDDEFGAFLPNQRFSSLSSRLGNHDDHGHEQVAPGVRYGDTCISARGRNEPPGTAASVFLASQANSANLERTARLHAFELEPDGSVGTYAQRTRFEKRCFNM
jgi:hypothetical protein